MTCVVLLGPSGRFSYKICVAKKKQNKKTQDKIERKRQGNAETSGLHSYICAKILWELKRQLQSIFAIGDLLETN